MGILVSFKFGKLQKNSLIFENTLILAASQQSLPDCRVSYHHIQRSKTSAIGCLIDEKRYRLERRQRCVRDRDKAAPDNQHHSYDKWCD